MEVVGEEESGLGAEHPGQQHAVICPGQLHNVHYPGYSKHDPSNGGVRLGSRSNGYDSNERRMVDITRDKPIKVAVRVQVPVRDHPKFNFVGKLLGPKGNSLKRLQEDTMCKMAVLGRGSMKDRQKEEELRVSGDPKFSHLMEDLHVEISAYATPAEAHARIAYALAEVRRFLVPDYNDDIRQEQMWEMQILNTQGRDVGQQQPLQPGVEAPLSPASSLEAASSPTAATTANSISDGQEDGIIMRPTPSPPHGASLKAQPGGTGMQTATASTSGRKRPLLPGGRLAMSPTKRTVMSLLARARAAQNKEPASLQAPATVSLVGAPPPPPSHQVQAAAVAAAAAAAAASPLIQATLQLPHSAAPAPQPQPTAVATTQQQVTQLQQQLAAAAQTIPQRQPLMQSHTQHTVLAPAIHGLLHAHFRRAAAGATVLPILREDFMAGVNQHQVQNVHIA
ncbi:KH domain-containing, RNA-binding, signal transduction-associated protein 1 [Copidosoma floridanum]|uniref:KH domain-containing, RNA-binding, signal transduction-associated protein 1 n=1 Tax=Copidosoma floridanum TaxID=29053 RepID=UPI000C6F6DFB|nr:KH domain-containing, RNA-binding, signal transduction-associated protein 1 [Copidosoma floridanum]